MGGDQDLPPSPGRRVSEFASRLSRNEAPLWLVLALAPPFLYYWGRLYLDGYYFTLGFAEAELHFDFPYVMMTSLFPLLYPTFWLVILGAVCLSLPVPQRTTTVANPFHPIRAPEAVAVVLLLWAVKILANVAQPPASVTWIAWHRRDVLFVLAGALVIAGLYWSSWRRLTRKKRRILSPGTVWVLVTNSVAVALVAWRLSLGAAWPLTPFETGIFFVGVAYSLFQVLRELRQFLAAKKEPSPVLDSPRSGASKEKGSWPLFLIVVSLISLILSSSLAGTSAAQETLRGCTSFRTVEFRPTPEHVEANHTYWLVLQNEGNYFLRDMSNGSQETLIVPENSGMTAVVGRRAAARVC